jgi:hypothetical protein
MLQSTMHSARHLVVSWLRKPQQSLRVVMAIPVLLASGPWSKLKLGSLWWRQPMTRAGISFVRSGMLVMYPIPVWSYLCEALEYGSFLKGSLTWTRMISPVTLYCPLYRILWVNCWERMNNSHCKLDVINTFRGPNTGCGWSSSSKQGCNETILWFSGRFHMLQFWFIV